MTNYGKHVQIRVTKHAHEQYCTRVETIDYADLNALCQDQFRQRDIQYCRRQFLRLSGVWWVTDLETEDNTLAFITCYGKTDFNVPKALTWAARYNDRLNLDGDRHAR